MMAMAAIFIRVRECFRDWAGQLVSTGVDASSLILGHRCRRRRVLPGDQVAIDDRETLPIGDLFEVAA